MKFVGNAVPSYPSALSPSNAEDIADKAYVDGRRLVATLGANFTTSGASVHNLLTLTVPANSVAVGDTFRITIMGVTTGIGNPNFSTAVGSSSPGSSQIWQSGALASSSGAAGCWADAMLTIKSIGASGTISGNGFGLATTSQGAQTGITTQALDTTATWYITARASITAATFTATSVVIQKV